MSTVEGAAGATPHGVLLAVIIGVVTAGPFIIGDHGQNIVEAIPEIIGSTGLFLLPVVLILVIRFLSSDRCNTFSQIFSSGSPDTIHNVGGSPVGVGLVLLFLLFLLYYRISLFGGEGDSAGG